MWGSGFYERKMSLLNISHSFINTCLMKIIGMEEVSLFNTNHLKGGPNRPPTVWCHKIRKFFDEGQWIFGSVHKYHFHVHMQNFRSFRPQIEEYWPFSESYFKIHGSEKCRNRLFSFWSRFTKTSINQRNHGQISWNLEYKLINIIYPSHLWHSLPRQL